MALIRITAMLTVCLAALGPTIACGNPDAEAWESLISKSEQVEKELEQLQAENLAFFGYNGGSASRQCARPTLKHMLNEVGHFDLEVLSQELDRGKSTLTHWPREVRGVIYTSPPADIWWKLRST